MYVLLRFLGTFCAVGLRSKEHQNIMYVLRHGPSFKWVIFGNSRHNDQNFLKFSFLVNFLHLYSEVIVSLFNSFNVIFFLSKLNSSDFNCTKTEYYEFQSLLEKK